MIKIKSDNKDLAFRKHTEACLNGIKKQIEGFEKALDNNGNKDFSEKIGKLDSSQKEKFKKLLKLLDDDFLKELILIDPKEMVYFFRVNKLAVYLLLNTKELKIVNSIFSYEKFIKKGFQLNNGEYWNAYELVKTLNVSVCPYCNRDYIFTATKLNHNKGTRPELDHFFPQNEYPFFRLSFFNLIPSCHTCNHLKLTKTTGLISPYNDDLIHDFWFVYIPQDVDSLYGFGNNFKVKLNIEKRCLAVARHDQTFLISTLYSNYGDVIQEMIWKRRIAGKEYIEKIRELFNNQFSDSELERLAFGNFLNEEDFHKRPLAKFMSDIAKELEMKK